MKYIVLDFEMNPIPDRLKEEQKICSQELIEIGAVLLDESLCEIDEYCSYVKPEYGKTIRAAVSRLTGITTEMVSSYDTFNTALSEFAAWCADCGDQYRIISWSQSDRLQLVHEMQLKHTQQDRQTELLMKDWEDFQKEFSDLLGKRNQLSLDMALLYAGLEFSGPRHDALWDARNTADLFRMSQNDSQREKILQNAKSFFASEPLTISLGDMINFGNLLHA